MKRYRAIPEYYDAEYINQDMLQCDVPFFLEQAGQRRSILELAVGTGRAAIPMAQAGHRVTGTDNDERMLRIARQKRDAVGLGARQLELLRGNMLSLDLERRFDWVCIFFNTFLVFTEMREQDQALQTVRRHLKPRGRLWIDIFQPNLRILARERTVELEPLLFYVPELDRAVHRTMEVRPDPSRQIQRITYHYTWFDRDGQEHHQDCEFDLTFIFPRELELLLERNGLRIEQLYGNYDGSGLDPDSPRMIARCRIA